MSIEPQFENFSQINLNAIKNTKLFQKFMQNKSGLIANNSAGNINKQRESKKQVTEQQVEIPEKKWIVNRNKDKVNNVKKAVISKKQQFERFSDENQKTIFASHQQLENSRNNIQRLAYQQAENSYVEPYRKAVQNVDDRMSNMQINQHIQMKNEQIPYNLTQQQELPSNPPNQNKRKRNFNPNLQNGKRQFNFADQNINNTFNNKPENNQSNQQTYLNKSDRFDRAPVEKLPVNNFNYYNTTDLQQRHSKPEISPDRYVLQKNNAFINQRPNQHQPLSSSSHVPFTELQYKQKYQSLVKKHQQLKQEFKNENKNRKKQFNEWEHQIEIIKEKLFDVQSREDSLLIQKQRLKDKCETQNLLKMKTQEENKELGYKIKELEDQLSMKQNVIKQKVDESNYWKSLVDGMKQDLNTVRLTLQKRNDEYNLLYGDYQLVKKQRDNKDYHLEDLRRSITSLVEQNSAAKDQLFKLVTKLYMLEQQNQVLRNDIKRQQFDNSQLNNYMKDLQQQTSHITRDRIQSTMVQRPHDRYEQARMERHNITKNQRFTINEPTNRTSLTEQDNPHIEKQTRRRGQFARERGQITRNQKPERDERPLPTTQNTHNISLSEQRPHNQPKQFHSNNNKATRINEISEELEKIKDMKAMNGAIRRRRIELERQLQDLQSQ